MIVLISGKQGAGKTTLSQNLYNKARKHHFNAYQCGFATAMRRIVNGIRVIAEAEGCPVPKDIETRDLMNFIATGWGRNLSEDFWIQPLRKNIAAVQKLWDKHDLFYMVLVDDMRFRNEFDAFNDMDDVFRIRVSCLEQYRKKRAKYWGDPNHPSETDLDGFERGSKFDLYLDTISNTPEENCDKAWSAIIGKARAKTS